MVTSTSVLILESINHPCPGKTGTFLRATGKIETTTLNALPASLETFSVIILNSLIADFKLDEELIIKFVQQGGGILCVHDTLFPGSGYMRISGITGVRLAFEAITYQPTEQAGTFQS
ncbi:MAG: hypothetical protein ABIG43_02335, partial [Chloroflexota bacterium]